MPRKVPYQSYQDDYAEDDKVLEFPSTSGQDYAMWGTFFCDATKHPAKANLAMISWIIDTYTKPGDVIVDPMAGTGSTCIIAMRKGRHAIAAEYEWSYAFRFLLKNIHNARIIGSFDEIGEGYTVVGDSRQLSRSIPRALELMGLEDRLVSTTLFSPPYMGIHTKKKFRGKEDQKKWEEYIASTGRSIQAAKKNLERWQDYGNDPNNIANMPEGSVDAVVSSPPYVGTLSVKSGGTDTDLEQMRKVLSRRGHSPKQVEKILSGKGSTTSVTMSKDARGYSTDDDNVGNLPMGTVDSVVTSPPYVPGTKADRQAYDDERGMKQGKGSYRQKYSDDPANIGNPRLYGAVDTVVSSPPYEGSLEHRGGNQEIGETKGMTPYTTDRDNIGNMTEETYMQAMYDLYQDAWKYTKSGGLLILIVKNFARHKAPVDLASDTIKLAELAGWLLMDRHYFRLPDKSFWIIQHVKKFAKRQYMKVVGVPGVKPKAPVNPCDYFIGTCVQGVRVWCEKDVLDSNAVTQSAYKRWVRAFNKWAHNNPEMLAKYAFAFRDTHISKVKISEGKILHWFTENECAHPWADYEDILVFVKPTPEMINTLLANKVLLPEIWSEHIT